MIDARDLAMLMLEWEVAQSEADDLRSQIESAVMEMKETQKVGHVSAKYRNGRKRYNYKEAVDMAVQSGQYPSDLIDRFTETKTSVDWRSAALDGAGIPKDEIPHTQSDPSVKVAIVK